jgi:hypothetical protein
MPVEEKIIWMDVAVDDAFVHDKGECFGRLLCPLPPQILWTLAGIVT